MLHNKVIQKIVYIGLKMELYVSDLDGTLLNSKQ